MNNQTTKQGFSLVEVMILFTVLAVTMAATLPVITKKSKAVPQNASTGVYRCIAIGNGKFLEERYNAKKLIKSAEVESCTFRPNKASVYKIDIYSAGAGGTKYAAYRADDNDIRNASFSMGDAESYATSGTLNFSDRSGVSDDMPYQLTNADIQRALGGIHIKKTGFTGDAGDGGSVTYWYTSPADAYCSTNANARLHPDIYNNATDYQFDLSDIGGSNNVAKHFEAYCLAETGDKEAHYPNAKNYNKIGWGGDGGKGKFIELDYAMIYGANESSWYGSRDSNFPFVRYIGELYGNIGNRGYEIVKCNQAKTSCDGSSITASNGESLNNKYNAIPTRYRTISSPNVYYTAEDGEDVGDQYLAFYVPNFANLARRYGMF